MIFCNILLLQFFSRPTPVVTKVFQIWLQSSTWQCIIPFRPLHFSYLINDSLLWWNGFPSKLV